MPRHITKGLVVGILTCAALAGWSPRAIADGELLVEGPPALTAEMVERVVGFLEWALDAPFTVEQRNGLTEGIVEAWRKGDQEEQDGVTEVLSADEQVGQLPEAERAFARRQIEPEILEALRDDPDDPVSQWLLRIHASAHQPIADGDPPLTRQVSDAYVEVLCFMISQVLGTGLEASVDIKDQFAASLTADYPQYDASARQELAKMPLYWAAIRVAWPTLPPEEQEAYRKQWAAGVAALVPPRPEAEPAGVAAPGADGRPALTSEDAAGFLERAIAEREAAQYGWAIEDCDRAIELDPKCASAYVARGQALEYGRASTEAHDRALQDYNRAIEVDPTCADAYYARAVYYALDQPDLSERDWAKARELRGQSAVETTGDARLDAMRKLQEHQDTMRWVSNMSMMSHEANMAVISNLGSGWTYEYRY